MYAYLLALEIEPVEVNRVYVALPLHCTVMHWFYTDKTPADVLTVITNSVRRTPPVQLVSGENSLFGAEQDVPVNVIKDNKSLQALHLALYKDLSQLNVTYMHPSWANEGFVPHVTRQRSGRFEQGREFTARKLYMAAANSPENLQQKKIVSKITLNGTV